MRKMLLIIWGMGLPLLVAGQSPAQQDAGDYVQVAANLQLRAITQIRYTYPFDTSEADGFNIRRARIDLRGDIIPKFEYHVQLGFEGSPKLLDATFAYKPKSWIAIYAGQGKPAFCYDNLVSAFHFLTEDRTQLDNSMAFRSGDLYGNQLGRDIGIWAQGTLHTSPTESDVTARPVVDYAIGIFNGAGINVTDNNRKKDISGALGFSPFTDFWIYGRFLSGTARTLADPGVDDTRKRYGGNIMYTKGRWTMNAEFLMASDKSDSLPELDRSGYYGTLGYFVLAEKLQLVARWDHYDPDNALTGNAVNKLGLTSTWYITHLTRVQIEYDLVREESGPQVSNDVLAIQLVAAF